MERKIVVVCGPTASGKTELSVSLAKEWDGEIVSADSMQIYRRMNIGTAKPTKEERQNIPHYMLDIVDPGESYSVSRYAEEAGARVEEILSRGKLPIVCGGTGLYIDGLIRGTDFQPCGTDSGLRQELEREWDEKGAEQMMRLLSAVDSEAAQRLHLNDRRRILRALEVFRATGETITAHNARTRAAKPRFQAVMLGLNTEPREILYGRIDRRVERMMEQGLEEEVRSLLRDGLLRDTAAQAIGYKEMLTYFRGEMTLAQATQQIQQKSRNYAKRQLTWFRRDARVHWIVYNEPEAAEAVRREATEYLRKNLYNSAE